VRPETEVIGPDPFLDDTPDDIRPVTVAVLVVAVAWLGAHHHLPPLPDPGTPGPVVLAGSAALAALGRRTLMVGLILVILTAVLTERAQEGLLGPEAPETVDAAVTLVSDPGPTPGGGIRAEARLEDGRRVSLVAHRSPAAALRNRLAGEVVLLRGELQAPGVYEQRRPHRHLSGRLQVELVSGWRPGHGTTLLANGLRRTLTDGAASLGDRHQSLLAGLLLGDSRHHPPDLSAAFRDSGLAHLLVVSGANVALLLVVLAPLLDRMRLAPRLICTLVALAFFALLTRGEPSVLRATAMAAVGATAAATGHPTSGLRRLAMAVTGLVLIDPLLVTSLGFQLSSAGAAGIVIGARPVADRLPLPRWLALPTGVTVASELAVAPLLAVTFGSVPLVSVIANLLAGPVAGAVKVWGLTAGLAAGLVHLLAGNWYLL
jgi:competence protein ComEC